MEGMKWPKDEKGVPYIIDAASLVNLVEISNSGEKSVITLLLNLNLMVQALCYKADSIKSNEYKDANVEAVEAKEKANLEHHRQWEAAKPREIWTTYVSFLEEAKREAWMMEASFTGDDIEILAKYAKGNDVIVELGTFKGGTTWFLATLFPESRVITVDEHWPAYIETFPDNVRFYHCKTEQAGKYVKEAGFVLVDAGHSEEDVIKDINIWAPKVKVGGYLLFHDVNWPAVEAGMDKVLPQEFELVEKTISNQLAVYRRKE